MNMTEKKEMDLKVLFMEEGMEKAPIHFTENIMSVIHKKEPVKQLYFKPIIPLFWRYFSVILLLGVLIYSSYNISTISYIDYFAEIFAKQKVPDILSVFGLKQSLSVSLILDLKLFLWITLFFGAGTISLLVNQKMFADR